MLRALQGTNVIFDMLVGVVALLALAFCAWLANDLLWAKWDNEEARPEARRLTWLIAANLAAVVAGIACVVWLVLRAGVW